MEGNGRPQRSGARDRIDPAGLVLRRRPRRRARSDHRPGLFLADRRARALALSHRPQAWRSSGLRLELRLRPSPRQVRQPLAAQAFRLRIRDIVRRQPLPGYSLTIERSSSGAERLSFKPHPSIRWPKRPVAAASHSLLGISCEFPRAIGDRPYRAIGDRIHVLSGTEIARKTKQLRWLGARNFSNKKSFGFFLTGTPKSARCGSAGSERLSLPTTAGCGQSVQGSASGRSPSTLQQLTRPSTARFRSRLHLRMSRN